MTSTPDPRDDAAGYWGTSPKTEAHVDRPVPMGALVIRTQILAGLERTGQLGRVLAPVLDLAATLGPVEVVRQRRQSRRQSHNAPPAAVYRSIWNSAAEDLGADAIDLGRGYLAIRLGGATTLTWLQEVQLDDGVLLRLAADKPMVHGLLAAVGIPVPSWVEVSVRDLDSALPFVRSAPAGCVVKPSADTGVGSAVTGGVTNRRDLHRAAARVARYGPRVLVERFLPGDMYRVTILDGTVLGVVRRRPPMVVGDGRRSVTALVAAENNRRFAASSSEFGPSWLAIDLDSLLCLAGQQLAPRSVPAAGRWVQVKFATNQNARTENKNVPVYIGSPIVELACRAAATVGLRFSGVDLLATAAATAQATDAVVLEVNGTPGLKLHGNVDNERGPGSRLAAQVAAPVLRAALAKCGHSQVSPFF